MCVELSAMLSLSLSLSAIYNPPLCTVLITTRILTWRCFYGATPPVAANACWIRAATTTNPTNPTKWILFCQPKNPTHRLLFFLNLLVLLLPFAPASSSSPCLSIYVCVSLSFLLGPSKLIMGSGGSGVWCIVCMCVFHSVCLVFCPIELVRPDPRASAESSVKMWETVWRT